MAELLIKAIDASHPDTDTDRKGCYKRGMPVLVMPDGHPWGSSEELPLFVVIKVPGVSVGTLEKYTLPQNIVGEHGIETYRRRLWRVRWEDLPIGAKNTLQSTGFLTIKVGTYSGPYDYTWSQIKSYFRNLETGLDETEDII